MFRVLCILPLYLHRLFLMGKPWVWQLPVFPFLVLCDIGDIVRDGATVRSQRFGYPKHKDIATGTVV